MKNIKGSVFLLFTLCAFTACSDAEWHSLTRLTQQQKVSASYKFLVSKFGANHILTKCDPQEAAELGEEYLIQVMDNGDGKIVGETIGHGATLQAALDNAATSYISPEQLRALDAYSAREDKEEKKREAEYRKKCCEVGK